jgi:solute carrier family 35 protein F1/2
VKLVLAICITSTNTLSTLLANEGTSIPAFQSFFNYVLLNLIYTSYTIYKYGFKRWVRLCVFEGWRFMILAFFDVEGNYFVVLAYRYVRSPLVYFSIHEVRPKAIMLT